MLYFGMKFKLEICVDSVESALNAQGAGADRVELCNNLQDGGTTPGFGTISLARKRISIEINAIIRPRGGDFLYSDLEYEIMRREIDNCGVCGINGVVLGILRSDGSVDVERTAYLAEAAKPMSVTFHRAFDMCNDPFKGLEDVIASGADRILTSGQENKAEDGTGLIKLLVARAKDRIIIMPGSGINESSIVRIATETGAEEFHFTGRKVIDSGMIFRRKNISMSGSSDLSEFSRKVADPVMIRSIINKLKMI